MSILLAVFLWRSILFFVSFMTQALVPFIPTFPYSDVYLLPSGLPQWIWSWGNFDGVHYITLAKNGYNFAQFTQAFFPVYPLVLRFTGLITGDKNFIFSGMSISFIAFACGIYLFRKLLTFDYNKQVINQSLLFLLFFPTSFYFGALYSESLFFLLAIGAFLCARRKKWWLSGILGGIASATRVTGVLLLPALLWEWQTDNIKYQISNIKKNKSRVSSFIHYSLFIIRSPVIYLVPLGLILYMVYLQFEFHDWLYFWHAQGAFGAERAANHLVTPVHALFRYTKILLTVSPKSYAFWAAFLEALAFLGGVLGLIYAHIRKVRISYLIFAWLSLVIPTLTGTFSSMPRYLLTVFPIFIALGSVQNKKIVTGLLVGSSILLIWLTSLFIRGLWVA